MLKIFVIYDSCIGLARMELFLFTANIFNRFRVSFSYLYLIFLEYQLHLANNLAVEKKLYHNNFQFRPNGAPPSKEKKFGLTVTPLPFTCQLSPKYV